VDTLNRHKKTHKDSASYGLPGSRVLISDQGGAAGSTHTGSQTAEMWNWQQESHHDNSGVAAVIEKAPVDNDLTSVSFHYPDLDQAHPPTFDDSEDILQYLFPSPVAWSMPETPSPGEQNLGFTSIEIPRSGVRDVQPRMEEASPQALLQLNNLIHDAVSNQ
jgi:hypothetical protein